MARVWLVLHIAPIRLKNAAMPKTQVFMFFVHFTLCTFHRSFFLREFRSFSGLFSFKRLAVTNTKKRKICYKPFDFFFPDSKVKKIGGAYQRPQGGGRGGGGRWSGWWRKVVGVVEEGGQMEDVVKNGKDICVFCEAKHTSEISIFFLWGKS